MWRILFFVAVALAMSVVGANGQASRIGVEVSVSSSAPVKSDIQSYIQRELRSLKDVDPYSLKPQFEIQLVAVATSSVVAISIVALEKQDFTVYLDSNLTGKGLDPSVKDFVTKSLGVRKPLELHALMSDSPRYLDELCKRIVAQIDVEVLEPERKLKRVIADYTKTTPVDQPRTTSKPVSAGESPFQSEYVGGSSTTIKIVNGTDRMLTLIFGGVKYTLDAGGEREIEVEGGRYEYSASVPRAYPSAGVKEFGKGYRFSWRFYIVRR